MQIALRFICAGYRHIVRCDNMEALPYLKGISLKRDKIGSFRHDPFSIPAVRELDCLELGKEVTFLAGENGSGKSTLLEALAVALGFNPEGGKP